MDELFEHLIKVIFHSLSYAIRMLVMLIWDWGFEVIGWYIGWPICRLISAGKYPYQDIGSEDDALLRDKIIVSLIGLLTLIALGALIVTFGFE